MQRKKPVEFLKKYGVKILAVCFWLLIWGGASKVVGQDIILSSPISVMTTLLDFLKTGQFWETVAFSSVRIMAGFGLAFVMGILLAVISFQNRLINEMVSIPMKVIKAMPMASFIILCLIWIKSKNLSVFISFFMVVPMFYTNVYQGLEDADEKLLQMAKVFRIGRWKKIKAIYIPSIRPQLISAITVGMGFCWKAGISAEVIGIPAGSIGVKLYEAKLYWMTKELFAWTFVIIAISLILEKTVMLVIGKLNREFEDKTETGEK